MKPVHAKRLLKLAEFLEALPRKRFDFSTWTGLEWAGKQDLSCGTTACALGWAATMPAFRRLGLQLDPCGVPSIKGEPYSTTVDASRHVFGLDEAEYAFLFTPDADPPFSIADGDWRSPSDDATPKQVAKHIRKFVAVRTAVAS